MLFNHIIKHIPVSCFFFPFLFYHFQDNTNRILPFLGKWKGHSLTKRSGVYGATIAEADTEASLEMDDKGQLIQVFAES